MGPLPMKCHKQSSDFPNTWQVFCRTETHFRPTLPTMTRLPSNLLPGQNLGTESYSLSPPPWTATMLFDSKQRGRMSSNFIYGALSLISAKISTSPGTINNFFGTSSVPLSSWPETHRRTWILHTCKSFPCSKVLSKSQPFGNSSQPISESAFLITSICRVSFRSLLRNSDTVKSMLQKIRTLVIWEEFREGATSFEWLP